MASNQFVDPFDSAAPAGNAAPPPPAPSEPPRSGPAFADPFDDPRANGQYLTATPAEVPRVRGGLLGEGIVDDMGRGAGFGTTARASLAPDPQDQIKRFAAARGIDPSLYGIVNGDIVYYDRQSGQMVKEVPSIGGAANLGDAFMRTGGKVAEALGPAIPGVVGGVTGAVTGGFGAGIPGAAGGAYMADQARQATDRLLAGEDLSQNLTLNSQLNSVGQAALAATGQGAGALLNRSLSRNPLGVDYFEKPAATNPANMQQWQDLLGEAKRRGIELSIGDVTDLSSLKMAQRQLARTREGADLISEFMQRRNTQQIPTAFRNETRNVGMAVPQEDAIEGIRMGAQKVIDKAVTQRTAAASPAYQEAFASGVEPDISPVLKLAETELGKVAEKTETARKMQRVRDLLTETVETVDPQTGKPVTQAGPLRNYEKLHSAKESIDSMIEDIAATGTSEEKRALRALTGVQQNLNDTLKAAHPKYAEGSGTFADMSVEVDALRKGQVGIIANMRGLERASLLDALFSSQRTTPGHVELARAAFTNAGAKAEWDAGLRSWLDNRLDAALRPNVQGGSPGNVAGKLYQGLWGEGTNQREIMQKALGDKARVEGMERLMQVLQAASRSLPEGSPTAGDIAGLSTMADSVASGVRAAAKVASPGKWINAPSELAEAYAVAKTPEARRQLTEALLSPDAIKDLRRLAMLKPSSQQAVKISTNLLTNAGIIRGLTATGVRGPEDMRGLGVPPELMR